MSSGSLINLTPGSTSQIAKRELSIDAHTWIDAAIGGDGDDVISGNQLDNASEEAVAMTASLPAAAMTKLMVAKASIN